MAERLKRERGFKLDFVFIPMPEEVLTADPPLLHAEWILLAYLLKQVRFGEALKDVSDDELMNGIFEDGKRKDQGCKLSRNGIKKAREALIDRGWLTAENVSVDPTRPRWIYRLIIRNKGESDTVTPRQLVSQRDTGTERQEVSKPATAVSQRDTLGVTPRQLVSPKDTCNKEDRKILGLDKELEKAGEAPPSALTISREKMMRNLTTEPGRAPDREVMEAVHRARAFGGLTATQAKQYLGTFMVWKLWTYFDQIDAQQQIVFPEPPPKPQPRPLPEDFNVKAGFRWQQILKALEPPRISRHSFDTWLKPTKGRGVWRGVLYVEVPTEEFRHIGEKFGEEIAQHLGEGIRDVKFVTRTDLEDWRESA